MLLIEVPANPVFQDKLLSITITVCDMEHIHVNDEVALFSPHDKVLYFGLLESFSRADEGTSLSLCCRINDETPLFLPIAEAFFTKHKLFSSRPDFFQKMLRLNNSFLTEETRLLINHEDSKVKFTYIAGQSISEGSIDISEWNQYTKTFERFGVEISFASQNSNTTSIMDIASKCGNMVCTMLTSAGIVLKTDLRLSVYYLSEESLIPFECVADLPLVIHRLPGISTQEDDKTDKSQKAKFTLIFDEAIRRGHDEAGIITDLLKHRFSIQRFSSRLYKGHAEELTNSRHFHFSGHGEVIDGKGIIRVNDEAHSSLPEANRLSFAFLNSCLVGGKINGIVGSLMKSGTELLIASPYTVNDTFDNGVSRFYELFHSQRIDVTFALSSLESPLFGLYYRVFSPFSYNYKKD